MPKPKSNKVNQSISFDREVFEALQAKCTGKNAPMMSTVVNFIVRQAVLSDEEYFRRMASYHSGLSYDYQMRMESARAKKEVQ